MDFDGTQSMKQYCQDTIQFSPTKLCIGIDPDKGISAWNPRQRKFEYISTTTFWGIINTLQKYNQSKAFEIHVFIETPQDISPIFSKHKGGNLDLVISKIGQKVGENKAKAKLIIEYMERNKIPYTKCKPTKKSNTKIEKEMFHKITGWKEKTSEHGRDAAMLVFGR